jgi:epoxyqueuosine reductase QueG
VLSTIEKVPTLIYKHHYKTVTWILDQVAEKLANFITSKGFRSFAIPSSQVVDWERYTGHFSHILIAKESGLGWIGRSGLLVNPKYGAKVRYAAVLTDFPLSVDKPITNMGCGECRECVKACPCGAITDTRYIKDKCLTQLKEFASIRGIGVSICGICVKVCNGGKYGV